MSRSPGPPAMARAGARRTISERWVVVIALFAVTACVSTSVPGPGVIAPVARSTSEKKNSRRPARAPTRPSTDQRPARVAIGRTIFHSEPSAASE